MPRCVNDAAAARPAMPPPMMATSSTCWPSTRRGVTQFLAGISSHDRSCRRRVSRAAKPCGGVAMGRFILRGFP
ncbi:hypothetical protein D3C87_1634680 [compost metagenome]